MPLPPRAILQYAQVLDCFPINVRNAIYSKSEYRHYNKGDPIFMDGDEGPYFLGALMSGRLRVAVRSREGKELLFSMIEKGELFGEMSVFDDLPRAVDIIADEESTVMIMMRDDFVPHLLACPSAVLNLFRMTCHRKRHYVRRAELLALQNVKQRLVRHLIHLSQDYGKPGTGGAIIIDAGLSQADIGLQLGMSRESVNKHIAVLEESGLLTYTNEVITLNDIGELKVTIRPPKP